MVRADLVKRKSCGIKTKLRDNIEGFIFAVPPVLRFIIFGFLPLVLGLAMAFLDMEYTYDVFNAEFIGFDNFEKVLKDRVFWESIVNTLYIAISWVISMGFALITAVILTKKIKGLAFYRTVYFLPFVCSMVAITLMWEVLLDVNYGAVNKIIEFLGGQAIDWRGDPDWYIPGLILMEVWSCTGYKIVILTAALTTVNRSYYEAASIDGANSLQQFWHVTIPAISPTMFFLLITGIIDILQMFTRSQVWSANGGPNGKAITIVFYLYREAFAYHNMGTASATAWMLSIIIIIITALNFALSKKWVKYD